ncbi:MAG: IS1634 family transposase [Parachlamydiaceae bacterium]|nr:IS1634 family transposase [Parachlamydiaceae bacterium]
MNNGQLTVGWLAFILSQANHCKNAVREWANKIPTILGTLLESRIRDVEFSDDRLANLLDTLSDDDSWKSFEDGLSKKCIEVYELPIETVRFDGSSAYGYHEVVENGIMQYGASKDHRPDLPQLRMMAATLDPGILIGIDLESGEKNDDSLYLPLILRMRPIINKTGVLFVGDCKMSSMGIRGDIQRNKDYYLTPLQLGTEKIRSYFKELVEAIVEGAQEAELIYRQDEKENTSKLIVAGYEVAREQEFGEKKEVKWIERIFIYRSFQHAKSEISLFEKKLKKIESELLKLTPLPTKGSRQFYEEARLVVAINKVVNKYELDNLLKISYEIESYNNKNRYVVRVERNIEKIKSQKRRCGWRLMATNAPREKLSFSQAILSYRQEWTLERCFRILKKSHLGISALYVRKEERIKGLTRLLSIGVRLMTLLEYSISESLKKKNEIVKGLDVAHPNKTTKTPTALSIFKKFCREKITLSKVHIEGKVFWNMTRICEDLIKVIKHLGIPIDIYGAKYYQNWDASQN